MEIKCQFKSVYQARGEFVEVDKMNNDPSNTSIFRFYWIYI